MKLKDLFVATRFRLAKRSYYKALRPSSRELSARACEALENLRHDGISVVPEFLSRSDAMKIYEAVSPDLQSLVSDNHIPGKFWAFQDFGVFRALEADQRYPETKVFFEDSFIQEVAEAYVSVDVKSYQRMSELRPIVGAVSSADLPHFDDWKIRFKAFLYLTDVTSSTAPFCYWKRSHTHEGARSQMELEYYRDGKAGSYGTYSADAIERIERLGFQKTEILGSAGTLILVDTRGVHSGTPLVAGQRVMLANYFDL